MSQLPLEEILDRAMALEPHRRAAYLDEVYAGNPAARAELESLLAVADRFPPPAEPPEEADPQAFTPFPGHIGRYPVVGVVGAGGMGLVYRVRDPDLEREVALKRLPPGIQADSAELARFRREARILARLRHPNIATVHSLETDDEGPFLTMELVPGQTLHAILATGRLPVARALRIGLQIAVAMEAAHAEGIVHRDLKPRNIQVGELDEVKVLDFGLAKAMDERVEASWRKPDGPGAAAGGDEKDENDAASAAADPVTLTGPIAGTPGYISPELLRGHPVGPAADVWAFGCILFECLAGTWPFSPSGSAARVPTRFRQAPASQDLEPDWSLLPEGLPAGTREFLRSCLRTEPADRPGSAAVRRALERFLRMIDSPTFAARLLSRRAGLAMVFLLAVIAGAVLVDRHRRPAQVGLSQSSVRQLTFRGNTLACDLAPDGETAAFLDETGRLVYLDLQAGDERAAPLTEGVSGEPISIIGARPMDLRWAPNGRELAVIGVRQPALPEMSTYLVARDSHRAVELDGGDFAGVVWSPDGERIAGTRGVGSRSELCIVERRTGRLQEVPLVGQVRPALVLDWTEGDQLFFRDVESDSVYVVPAGGGRPRAVMKGSWLRCLPARNEVCYRVENQLRLAALGPGGVPAAAYTVLADRVPPFSSPFSLARDGRRILYNSAAMVEVWLGERASAAAGDDGFRWNRLVRESISTYAARFSPDGSKVALVGSPVGETARFLLVHSLEDGSRTVAARDTAINYPDWSPDGTELVYRNSRGMARVPLDDSGPRQVPGPRDPMYLRWLPDGRIVYMEGDGDLWQAYSQLDPASGRITRLPIDEERGTLLQFAVAPDRKSLAVAGNRGEQADVKVWLVDLTDGSERLLYDDWAAPFDWSADGRWVYLVTEKEPSSSNQRRSQVLRVAVADLVAEHVADLPEPAFTWDHIDLSPDGRRIAFDQRRTGRDLWLMDIEPIRK